MASSAQRSIWRAWLLVWVALWMSFAPAAVAAGLPRFLNETTTVTGAEPSASPALHIYLYANADPLMFSDPSGHLTLAELQVTENVVGVLNRALSTIGNVWRYYNLATNIIDTVGVARDSLRFLYALSSGGADSVPGAVLHAITSAFRANAGDLTHVLNGFGDAFKIIGPNWEQHRARIQAVIPELAADVASFMTTRLPTIAKASRGQVKWIIYAPSSPVGGFSNIPITVRKNLQINVSVGGGRLFGLGFAVPGKRDEQIFRIDYWDNSHQRWHYHVQPNLGTHHYF